MCVHDIKSLKLKRTVFSCMAQNIQICAYFKISYGYLVHERACISFRYVYYLCWHYHYTHTHVYIDMYSMDISMYTCMYRYTSVCILMLCKVQEL